MEVLGTAVLYLVPDNCTRKRRVEALVSPDLQEADILLSWQDMRRPCWGLLPKNFPDITDEEEVCNRVETSEIKKDEKREDKKESRPQFWAAQRKETFEEREARLNRKMRADLMEKYASVFTEKLEKEDRIWDVEAELEIREDDTITPTYISTARGVPKHFQAASEELVRDLLAANIIEEVRHATD